MPSVFITGTDTECGKTHVACALLHALAEAGLRVAGYKPVSAGCERTAEGLRNEDALALMAAANVDARYEEVNPLALEPPIAPHIAAEQAGLEIDLQALRTGAAALAQRCDWLVVEGAGGYRVPLCDAGDMAELARGMPVILVVGMKLGCLNHALLTAEAIARRGEFLAWVANCLPPEQAQLEANLATLRNALAAPCLGVLPPGVAPREAARELDLSPLRSRFGEAAFAPPANSR